MLLIRRDSKGVLYIVGAVAVALLCALLVGWNLILIENYLLATRVQKPDFHWIILSLGSLFFIAVMLTIVLLVRYLVRYATRQRFQQLLLDSVTHELKSPLASMRVLMETLQLRELPKEQEQGIRSMIIEDLERLDTLIDHMLAASRVEQQRRALDLTANEVAEVVTDVVDQIRRRWGADFSLEIDLTESPERFVTDRPSLEILLFNLLDNAVKYSTGEPAVTVRVSSDEAGWLLIEVKDRGIGLDRRELRRVFGRFYRVLPKSPDQTRDGVGLGLFVVHGLVERLGGKVWAESEGLGKGAVFVVGLPPESGLATRPETT